MREKRYVWDKRKWKRKGGEEGEKEMGARGKLGMKDVARTA